MAIARFSLAVDRRFRRAGDTAEADFFNCSAFGKQAEFIERYLKKFKRKFEKTGVIKELRSRQQFDKPSVLKRLKMEHAIYVQKLRANEE